MGCGPNFLFLFSTPPFFPNFQKVTPAKPTLLSRKLHQYYNCRKKDSNFYRNFPGRIIRRRKLLKSVGCWFWILPNIQYSIGRETNKKQDGILIIPFMLLITIDREKYNRRYPLCCWYRVLNYIKESYFAENDHYRHRNKRRGRVTNTPLYWRSSFEIKA